jgi:hypothetical protein
MNRFFEKFEKYLLKFCDIETLENSSTVYFSKNSKILFFKFYFLKNPKKFGKFFFEFFKNLVHIYQNNGLGT